MLKQKQNTGNDFNDKIASALLVANNLLKILSGYRNYLFICLTSFILIVVVFYFSHHNLVEKEISTFEILANIEKDYNNLIHDSNHKIAYNKTKDRYILISDEFSNSKVGKIAKIALGHASYDAGFFADAVILYSDVLQELDGKNIVLKNIVLTKLAHSYLSNACLDEAKACFEQILSSERSIMKDEALMNIALLHEFNSKTVLAKKLYEQFLVNFPNSLYTKIIRQKMGGVDNID